MDLFSSIKLKIYFDKETYSGTAIPLKLELSNGFPYLFRIVFDNIYFGDITFENIEWICSTEKPYNLAQPIGEYNAAWYE
jgi:hypothetical protein